ncbi:DUF7519 family protein [Natronococcus occultus]|uniref:Uncharacterized protein n=1 Tax=Natronococcus occultus SP4 TaxID=694430 RepID=L0JZT0_9EURY|nr:hypothetical protein [Natronococcus occultus]AGB37614.1 hypothetical protein Natoc_1819 [Natronococcus occultus SP4]
MSEITRRPTIASSVAAAVAVLVAVLAAGSQAASALGFAAVGGLVFVVGLALGRHRAVDVGALVVLFGVVAGGLEATAVEPTIVAAVATVVAWDLAHGAIALGDQLGRGAETRRLEAVRVSSSLLVGLASGTVGYAVYVFGGSGQPVAAVTLLLVAAVLIVVGFGGGRTGSTRRRRTRP